MPTPWRTSFTASGEAAAAFLAGAIGCFVLGLLVTLTAMPALVDLKNGLNWSKPVGPLSGKTGVAIIAFLLAVLRMLSLFTA